MKNCIQCKSPFEVTEADRAFLLKVSPVVDGKRYLIPESDMCPDCRRQRRLMFRNERSLYRRNCNLCKKSFIAIYPADAPFPVYCNECYWSDNWDPLKYGRDFDFSRPFFEQFRELNLVTPKAGTLIYRCENCEYNSLQGLSRNTYMSSGSFNMEDCLYVRRGQYCKDCVDGFCDDHCELVYEAINCKECYNADYLIGCNNVSNSKYMAYCDSCKNCFMCSDLHRGTYCFMNDHYSAEEYAKKVAEMEKKPPEEILKLFLDFSAKIPKRATTQVSCENCVGDQIFDCKNAYQAYNSFDLEDCRYVYDMAEGKDMMDIDIMDKMNELCYFCTTGGDRNRNAVLSFCIVDAQDIAYCYNVWQCQKMFGCSSIFKKLSHCVFNKRYTEDEYEKLVAKIIEHMRRTGEWGQFFPPALTLHGYNESMANDFFPLTKEEAKKRGFNWAEIKEEPPKVEKTIPAAKLPDAIGDIPDDILNWAILCKETGKPYKIQSQELKFYRKKGLPIPRLHPDVRYMRRFALLKPARLFDRECALCGAKIQTSYAPNRPERVYCETCYLKTVR